MNFSGGFVDDVVGAIAVGARSSAACSELIRNSFTQPEREGRAPERGREFHFIAYHWLEEVVALEDDEDAGADVVSDAVAEEDAVAICVVIGAGAEAVVAVAVGSVFHLAMCAGIGTLEVASV